MPPFLFFYINFTFRFSQEKQRLIDLFTQRLKTQKILDNVELGIEKHNILYYNPKCPNRACCSDIWEESGKGYEDY